MKAANRYFKVQFVQIGGGEVQQEIVEFYELTASCEKIRSQGFVILGASEWK